MPCATSARQAWARDFPGENPDLSNRHLPEGTAAGLVGAFVLGSLAVALGLVQANALGPIVLAATIGAFAESALGATLEV